MQFELISLYSMSILLGWGVSNVGIGVWRQWSASDAKRYFWQMNGMWGLVNTVIAALTLIAIWGNYNNFASDAGFQQSQIEIVGINFFLNIVYIAVGVALIRVAAAKISIKRRAYGWSIIIQGAFLFIFDASLWVLLRSSL